MKLAKSIMTSAALIFAFSIHLSAQDDEIKIETNLVTVNVAITDKKGNYVKGMKREDFEVFDNRVRQEIENFSAEEAPVSFGIIYDMHTATGEQARDILGALRQFTRELKEKDNFFVTVFNERGSLTTEFVPTGEQIEKFLTDAKPTTPNSLYDAIYAASEKVRARTDSKQVLLVLTDGADHSSHHSLKELRLRLRSVNLPVYTITFNNRNSRSSGYEDLYRNQGRRTLDITETSELNTAALAEISKTSGGKTFDRQIQNRYLLYGIFKKVAAEVENQYVLGFYPETADGKWHKLKVSVKAEKGAKYKLSNRNGYQSPRKN